MHVNDIQIGGSHYKGAQVQHWDLVELNGVGYLEGCATKYVQRRKDPTKRIQDLEKAKHYAEKALQLYNDDLRRPRGCVPLRIVKSFCDGFNLSALERTVINLLCNWRTPTDMHAAISGIEDLIAIERGHENSQQEAKASA